VVDGSLHALHDELIIMGNDVNISESRGFRARAST
jgi:hypothetical protein